MFRASGIFFILLLVACAEDSSELQGSDQVTSSFIALDSTMIHGLTIGSKSSVGDGWHDSLISKHSASPNSQHPLLQWRSESGSIKEIDITYQFDSLANVELSYYELKEHLITLYGAPRPTAGYSTWKTASERGYLVEVELIDAGKLFQRPELNARWKLIEDRLYED